MFINKHWVDYILLVLLIGVVVVSWVYTLYTARLTGIKYLEDRFGIPFIS